MKTLASLILLCALGSSLAGTTKFGDEIQFDDKGFKNVPVTKILPFPNEKNEDEKSEANVSDVGLIREDVEPVDRDLATERQNANPCLPSYPGAGVPGVTCDSSSTTSTTTAAPISIPPLPQSPGQLPNLPAQPQVPAPDPSQPQVPVPDPSQPPNLLPSPPTGSLPTIPSAPSSKSDVTTGRVDETAPVRTLTLTLENPITRTYRTETGDLVRLLKVGGRGQVLRSRTSIQQDAEGLVVGLPPFVQFIKRGLSPYASALKKTQNEKPGTPAAVAEPVNPVAPEGPGPVLPLLARILYDPYVSYGTGMYSPYMGGYGYGYGGYGGYGGLGAYGGLGGYYY